MRENSMNEEKKQKKGRTEKDINLEMDENITFYQSKVSCDDSFARISISLMLVR